MNARGDGPEIIMLPKIHDTRGNLTFVEALEHIPFEVKRTFWIYDIPGGEVRAGHAQKQLDEFIIALTGSFDVAVDDGINTITYSLDRSYYGLYVPHMFWRELRNFSTNAVAMVLASRPYEPQDYIYHYDEYKRLRQDASI